jgi:hypothetical protein
MCFGRMFLVLYSFFKITTLCLLVSYFSPPYGPTMMLCLPEVTEPRDHALTSLTPSAKINLSSLNMFMLSILSHKSLINTVGTFFYAHTRKQRPREMHAGNTRAKTGSLPPCVIPATKHSLPSFVPKVSGQFWGGLSPHPACSSRLSKFVPQADTDHCISKNPIDQGSGRGS